MILLTDEDYDRWALYVQGGVSSLVGAQGWAEHVDTVQEKGSSSPDDWVQEEMIEECVSEMAWKHLGWAQALRLQYGASQGFHITDSVERKARHLKVSRSTYYNHLANAKALVEERVSAKMEARWDEIDAINAGRIN